MSDLSSQLSLVPRDADAPAADPEAAAPVAAPGFAWPTPPYAVYPNVADHPAFEPCEVLGLNGKAMAARLVTFDPAEGVAQVQVPPSRTTLTLRSSQFRSLTLTQPLRPGLIAATGAPGALMDFLPATAFTVRLVGGGELTGRSIGHVETSHGLYFFPPVDDKGGVLRMFCPRSAYETFEYGPRLGEQLLADDTATPAQIAAALAEQAKLREQRIGDMLLSNRVVTPEQLMQAIESQSRMPMVRVGEALIALGYISPGQLDDALAQQQSDRSVPLGELLVRSGAVRRHDLRTALSRKMGYPVVDVDAYPIEAEALRQLPAQAAKRLQVLPLQLLPGRLVIAIEDPSRRDVLDEVEFISQNKAVPVLPAGDHLTRSIAQVYQKHGLDEAAATGVAAELSAAFNFDEGGTDQLLAALEQSHDIASPPSEEEKPIEQSDNSLVRLINTMIVEAHGQGVSDIHIETQPGREKVRIRFRRDGALRPYLELPHTYRNALIARLKIMCDLDISERRRPQDGKITFSRFVTSCPIELRVATIPTANGLEDAVLRILASAKPLPLDKLGLSPPNLEALKTAIERPYGMVLCVGPTGSGKTTTLHSALSHINTPERKIWTAEDPVEITQAGLRQVQVNPKIDWTFAKALRAFLRADPDVIMVGEIRDQETAQIAVESSLTGHLVLSTLHTNSAAETITRLLDMGMDPFNFADSLLAVLAQRLVRRVCPHCRQSRPAHADEVDEWVHDHLHSWHGDATSPSVDAVIADWTQRFAGPDGRLQAWRAPGCPQCDHSGLRGRAGIHELLTVSRSVRQMIQTGARAEQIQRQAMAEGMRTLRQDGLEKVLAGITTIEEVRATSNG
ncbi:ATPase, T2SS/T4P/T4SS family [Ideonella sp. DXS29W]|uniref:ATPase, T2SS/T4P/T4SS family n=1 Tax=Ideonella lacteola TaxID=2984193 RepID=A0ABU9BHE5_9BURK